MLALNLVPFVKSKYSGDERGEFSSVMGGLYAIPDKFGQVFCYKSESIAKIFPSQKSSCEPSRYMDLLAMNSSVVLSAFV